MFHKSKIELIKKAVEIEVKAIKDENEKLKQEIATLKDETKPDAIEAALEKMFSPEEAENPVDETLTDKQLHDYIFKIEKEEVK